MIAIFFKLIPAPGYYDSPTNLPDFTDIVSKDLWQNDTYFTQLRLAGSCPFFLRKVVQSNGKNYCALIFMICIFDIFNFYQNVPNEKCFSLLSQYSNTLSLQKLLFFVTATKALFFNIILSR